jgi:hypothetical protein
MTVRRGSGKSKTESLTQRSPAAQKSILLHPLLGLVLTLVAVAILSWAAMLSPNLWNDIQTQFRLVPAETPQSSVFGFAEYLAALALMFVVLAVSDFRYRLRLIIAPINIMAISFAVSFSIGFLLLIIDMWIINKWLVPSILKDLSNLKLLLALIFLITTCYASCIAFIIPPRFSKWNAKKAFEILKFYVARGNAEQLTVVADWMALSAGRIVNFAASRTHENISLGGSTKTTHKDYAAYTLSLLGDRKLCRQMVETSTWTIAEFFQVASKHIDARLPLIQFASNIGTELVINPRSALYFEDDGYASGFLGFTKPITRSVYGNFELVEALGSSGRSPLDIDLDVKFSLTPPQLSAYARGLLIFSSSYFSQSYHHHSYVFTRALDVFQQSNLTALATLEGRYWQADEYRKLKISIDLIKNLITLLSEHSTPTKQRIRHHQTLDGLRHAHHQISLLVFHIIKDASRLRGPQDICWAVQYQSIWSQLFRYDDSPSRRLIAFYLRRLMYDEINDMNKGVNFVGAGIIGFCLNVLGISSREDVRSDRDDFTPLRNAAIAWTEKNYLKLSNDYPAVADAILVGGITFDQQGKRLVRSYASFLGKPPLQKYLQLTSDGDATTSS